MKGIVIVLLSLIAFAVCQLPASCADATVTKLPNPTVDDGSWSETYTLNSATENTTTTCFSVPWAANGTLVIAARLTEEGTNTTLSVYAYKAATAPTTVDVVDEDDVDSVCVSDNTTYVSAANTVYFYVTGPNGTEYQLWDDFSTDDDPPCGADVTVSGGSNFWIWIIVAVVIVIAIAVIIAGAGAFVYYQKKKKGQAKLYEDS